MGKETISATNVVAEGLAKASRKIKKDQGLVPKEYAVLGIDELFQRFLAVAPEFKGNLAAAYGSYGHEISLSAVLDFGSLLLPGLSLGVSFTGSVKMIDEALIVIQRNMPEKLIDVAQRDTDRLDHFLHTLSKPVALLALQGYQSGGKLQGTAFVSVGASVIPFLTIDFLSLSLGGAEVNIIRDTSVYYFEDANPGWYSQGADPLLKTDFQTCLGTRHTHYLKREMTLWLKYVRKILVNKLPNDSKWDDLKAVFKNLPGFSPFWLKASTDDVLDKLDKILNELRKVQDADFPPANKNDIPGFRQRLKEYKDELVIAKNQKTKYITPKKSINTLQENTNIFPALCHVAVTSIKNEASLTIAVGTSTGAYGGTSAFGANAISGSSDLANQSGISIGGPTVAASFNVGRKSVSTSYRYQNYGISDQSKQRIIYTQDTEIHYKTLILNVNCKLALDFAFGRDIDLSGVHAPGIDKVKTWKDKLNWDNTFFNAMSYKAVIAYWRHPGFNSTTAEVHTHNGSGLAFGFSVRMQDILQLARDLYYDNEKEKIVVARMETWARSLRITTEQLKEFILGLISKNDLEDKDPFADLKQYGAVLLESSYRLKKHENLTLLTPPHKVQDLTTHASWKNFYQNEGSTVPEILELECVRLRVRIADHAINHRRSVFRLGFMIFGIGFTAGNDEITEAGNEGIFDLYAHWYKPVDRRERRRRSTTYRDAVPPVALLPHPIHT